MDEQISILEVVKSEEELENPIRNMLEPPNPIITKNVENIDEKATFKIDTTMQMQQHAEGKKANGSYTTNKTMNDYEQSKKSEQIKFKPYMKIMTLANGYESDSLIFRKFSNDNINRRGKKKFFSSLFIGIQGNRGLKLPQYKGMICDNDLIFDSNFESANLMAVYKIEDRVYDLVLQNDLNTKGFTQWYNFKILNKRNNFIARFNIVNLYKSKSLYSLGMKPIVRSEKSDKNTKKIWRRRGYNIYYEKNELSYEDNLQKCYKTLTFQYDFTIQNDTVQFAHGMPYDLTDLHFHLNSIKGNPKVKMSTIGLTIMGRPIPVIKISGADDGNKLQKKALVILGRQHPGETPGSYIAEEMILELLRNSNEVDFLIWRFDIFIIPMVNMDGVHLGNYRSNFAGFDLNRCWLRPDPIKQPEVIAIKNYIKKLQKKYKIELILDLHGHSRKMGSFFYGNNYGPNFMLFPYVASKGNKNILFEKSRFSHESEMQPKGSTARVVLGNMIKDTGGYVYTYEVSFFGNYKEDNTPFAFQQEHYKELGKSLVISIYRTYLEIYKEEKTLKQSHFLKSVKSELHKLEDQKKIEDEDDSGSDSEAEEQMEQEREEIEQFFEELKDIQQFSPPPIQIVKRPSAYEGIDREISISKIRELKQLGLPVQKYNLEMKQKIQSLLERNINDDLREVILARLPSIKREQRQNTLNDIKREASLSKEVKLIEEIDFLQEPESAQITKAKKRSILPQYFRVKKYKNYADWLKVYGETFALQQRQKQRSEPQKKKESHNFNEKDEKKVQQIKHNLLLINNAAKSTEKDPKLSKQLNTINMVDKTFEKGEEKESDYFKQILTQKHHRSQTKSRNSKDNPLSVAFDQANNGPIRVNRVEYQKEQCRARRFNSTPLKQNQNFKSKLPPI